MRPIDHFLTLAGAAVATTATGPARPAALRVAELLNSAPEPTTPLPPEYPEDKAFFTVTFFYNENPPGQ